MDYYEKLNFDRVKRELNSVESNCSSLIPAINNAVSDLKSGVANQLNKIKWDDEVGQAIKEEISGKANAYAGKWESDHRRSLEDLVNKIKDAVISLEKIISTYES